MYDLKKEEIEQRRTAQELNEWFEETLNKFNTKEGIRAIRLKQIDEIKVFMEESSTLNTLCQNLFAKRNDILFKQVLGSQSYDVIVKGCKDFDYIEITYVSNKEEHLRMILLDEKGSVSAIAPVEKNDGVGKVQNASQLKCKAIALEHSSIIQKSTDKIIEVFHNKSSKSEKYPDRTHLVIGFDDAHYFEKDSCYIEELFNNYIVPRKENFISISLVGLNKNIFYTS